MPLFPFDIGMGGSPNVKGKSSLGSKSNLWLPEVMSGARLNIYAGTSSHRVMDIASDHRHTYGWCVLPEVCCESSNLFRPNRAIVHVASKVNPYSMDLIRERSPTPIRVFGARDGTVNVQAPRVYKHATMQRDLTVRPHWLGNVAPTKINSLSSGNFLHIDSNSSMDHVFM